MNQRTVNHSIVQEAKLRRSFGTFVCKIQLVICSPISAVKRVISCCNALSTGMLYEKTLVTYNKANCRTEKQVRDISQGNGSKNKKLLKQILIVSPVGVFKFEKRRIA